ncbi:DNA-directed RNA polymerase III, subunit Rpc31 [Trichoderma chlorosporum]
MSRGGGGGRGGGRGGRGGGRGGRPALPWDDTDEPDARPSELFPPCVVPTPRDLTTTEYNSVQCFLLLRHQIHSSPLYTSKRTSLIDPAAPRKVYGRDQMNALYDVKSKASVDPFNAMPTYSQRFSRPERALPEWSSRPVCREMFPPELLDTVDSADASGVRKRRKLELSKISALPNAEEAFGMPAIEGEDDEGVPVDGKNILERLDALRDDEGDDAADVDDDEGLEEEEEDEVYDDEDAGDYDAETYFDNGDDGGDDYGDGDDGEGTY